MKHIEKNERSRRSTDFEKKELIYKQPKCDLCGKPAVWQIAVFSRVFFRCKEHRHLISREYANAVYYKGAWREVWNVQDTGWSVDKTMDMVRIEGLEKNKIPLEKYID